VPLLVFYAFAVAVASKSGFLRRFASFACGTKRPCRTLFKRGWLSLNSLRVFLRFSYVRRWRRVVLSPVWFDDSFRSGVRVLAVILKEQSRYNDGKSRAEITDQLEIIFPFLNSCIFL
jgi:hypothetical protein